MEQLVISVENFQDGVVTREINSPRTLEACLRSGFDPSELYPKPRGSFVSKGLTKEMIDIKYEQFETKRKDKVATVKAERAAIIKYAERKRGITSQPSSPNKEEGVVIQMPTDPAERAAAALEAEEKRMEALRRRQEKELNKIIEREQALVALHLKIKHAEEEEVRKKKAHEKHVQELRLEAEKKKKARAEELKRLEQEELEKKKELAKREAAFEEKRKRAAKREERRIMMEARARDRERAEKMEEYRKKTEALIEAQVELAEKNRIIMMEREARVQAQLNMKKEQKREEVAIAREKATKRIQEALEKHHELHEAKKRDFNERQRKAEILAKENHAIEIEKLKKQSEDREKKNKLRMARLIDAYRHRNEHRQSIIDRRKEKDSTFSKIQAQRDAQTAMLKFMTDLKLKDKLENVERTARMNEFKRLQTLKRIEDDDMRYENIQNGKRDLMRKYRMEEKRSLCRKHEIADAMDTMRVTGDFTLLDKIFAKNQKSTKPGAAKADKDDGDGDDPRLAQTA